MSNALSAFGTLLKMADSGGANHTNVAEITALSLPSLSADTEEATHHESPGTFEEVLVTILRSGEVTFSINYLPTNATQNGTAGLLYVYKQRQKRNFQIVLPDAGSTTWEFDAYVTGFEPEANPDGKLAANVTLKPTGEVTIP